jgi:quinol monooxygenase YgiN
VNRRPFQPRPKIHTSNQPESKDMKLPHHQGVLKVTPEHMAEFRDMLIKCEKLVLEKQSEGRPINWSCTEDREQGQFDIFALFPDNAALDFHQKNIKSYIEGTIHMLAAPPETIIREVFAKTSNVGD